MAIIRVDGQDQKIGITPAMIEAGVEVLAFVVRDGEDLGPLATEIFVAMLRAGNGKYVLA